MYEKGIARICLEMNWDKCLSAVSMTESVNR